MPAPKCTKYFHVLCLSFKSLQQGAWAYCISLSPGLLARQYPFKILICLTQHMVNNKLFNVNQFVIAFEGFSTQMAKALM